MPAQESDSDNRERGPLGIMAAIILLLIPAAYVFSTGPVEWLLHHGYINDQQNGFLYWLYTPIRHCYQNSAACRVVLDWWLQFWK
jgi:hypothetical protein